MPPSTQAPVPLPKDNDNNSVVSSSTVGDEKTSNKKTTTTTGNPKRQKIVKACKDCRRRKVKCDGATPCGTCKRSSIQCIFESTSPKRGTSKHYIESLENRLFVMEKAVNSLSGPTAQLVKEAVRREEEHQLFLQQQKLKQQQQEQPILVTQQLQQQQDVELFEEAEEDRYLINEFGSPSYIADISSFIDVPITASTNKYYYTAGQQMDSSQSTTNSSSSGSPKSSKSSESPPPTTRQQDEIEIQNHLKFYLIQIQPYFPLFVPNYFNRQYNNHELPKILIYSMCALSCLFQQLEEHYSYYQRALIMLDEAIGKPSIPLVQTLLLLIKYKEQQSTSDSGGERGYFEKIKSLLSRTIEIAKILKLNQGIVTGDPLMIETRKRTWCMLFTCNILLCVEQGLPSNNQFLYINEQYHLPSTVSDESTVDCARYIIQFSNTLDQIHKYILRITKRQEVQKDLRDEQQILEENMSIFHLQVKIENDLLHLPSNLSLTTTNMINYNNKQQQPPQFPAEDVIVTISPMTRLLHLIYHLNVLLLHFHYTKYPLPVIMQQQKDASQYTVYPHRQICSSSASHIIRLIEGLISDPTQSYRYSPRGLQFICHCITFSFTILQYEVLGLNNTKREYLDEYTRCAHLLQQVSSASPSNEMRLFAARELDLNAINLDISMLKVSSSSSSSSVVSTSTNTSPIMNYPLVQSPTGTASISNDVIMTNRQQQQKRRNTISHRPPPPTTLLQLSSTNISHQLLHHPLHNIHATPLQHPPPQQQQHQLLRGSSQSCNDLKSLNGLHAQSASSSNSPPLQQYNNNPAFTQHRKPVGSVISSSTTSTSNTPYRNNNTSVAGSNSIRNVSPLPYSKPMYENHPITTQSTGFPTTANSRMATQLPQQQVGKIRKIKKSQSIHGLSSSYRQQQQQPQLQHPSHQAQQYQLYQQQQQQQQQFQFQQQLNNLLATQNGLHRPYQPTFDDFSISSSSVKYGHPQEDTVMDDFSMNVDDLNFLSNYNHSPMEDPTNQQTRSEGHHLL